MKPIVRYGLLAAVLALLISLAVYALTMNPYRGSLLRPSAAYPPEMEQSASLDHVLDEEQVAEDLKQAHRLIRSRHPAWLLDPDCAARVDAAFEQAYRDPEPQTVAQLQQTICELTAALEDRNTRTLHRSVVSESEDSSEPVVEYQVLPEQNAAIFTLRRCVVNETFGAALESCFQEIVRENISNLILDLRGNEGGNLNAALLFLEYLNVDTLQFGGKEVRRGWYLQTEEPEIRYNNRRTNAFSGTLYLLTDQKTNGSALEFAMLLADNDLAVHVGETPETKPDHYEGMLCFRLRHSGLQLDVAYQHIGRIDTAKSGEYLEPDIGSDDPVQTVLQHIADID